jgi:hypothetical protein
MKRIVAILSALVILTSLASLDFGKNKVQPRKPEWTVIHTLHFDIYYPRGADEFGKTAALMAEDAYYYLKDAFDTPLMYRTPIVLYQSHQEFETTNIIYPLLDEGVGGFTESFKNRVVIPFDGSYVKFEKVLVHELTHVYQKGPTPGMSMFSISEMIFPFWMQEGQPEFMAVGGKDDYNNMFVYDLALNDGIQTLDEQGGYYAYRLGGSFLVYLESQYGRRKVMEFYRTLRMSPSADEACKRMFGMKFDQLQARWKNQLKRDVLPLLQTHTVPCETYQQRTDHRGNDTYFNYGPAVSPDGRYYVYFSNKGLRLGIWKASSFGVFADKCLIRGESSGKFEEFHYLRNNLSWFPDSRRFAFSASTVDGDHIYVMDIEDEKLVDDYKIPGVDIIYELAVSRDGSRIAFTGQSGLQTDLYVYGFDSGELTRLADDPYDDSAPAWSPSDSLLAFTSERTMGGSDSLHICYNLRKNIFVRNLTDGTTLQITDDRFNNHDPMFDSTGKSLLFISDRTHIANYEMVDLASGARQRITNTLSGVFPGSLTGNDDELFFSCYYNGGWDVYSLAAPFDKPVEEPVATPFPVTLTNDFHQRFDIDRYRLYGKRDMKFRMDPPQPRHSGATVIDFRQSARQDSLDRVFNRNLDQRPDSVAVEPQISPYRPHLTLDRLWGGGAYSTSVGAIGFAQFSFTDLMGDYGLGVQIGLAGKLKNTNFIASYMYLPQRIDYGVGVFAISDETIYDDYWMGYDSETGQYQLYDGEEVDRMQGGEVLVSYPFNRFWRVDVENLLYQRKIERYWWNEDTDKWIYVDESHATVYSPQVSLVHDNALWGITGPIGGWRAAYLVNKSFSGKFDYLTQYADIRPYWMLTHKYTLAFRAVGGISTGKDPQNFEIGGLSGVRGLDNDFEGSHIATGAIELRYPFLEMLQLGFPLPLTLSQIRGSLYMDAGGVWDHHFVGSRNGRLQDMKAGFGFGPRINLSYFILKMDIAWGTDFVDSGKPNYYVSLSEDF